ncbi:MAG: HEAT repeat domain-containing protein [Chloroflexota bacterium]|nr:HEAT repeat domain-containing protein [Chloroflexota bacterium]
MGTNSQKPSQLTGREPRLAHPTGVKGARRLSMRRLATMLNVLPPDAISLDAAEEMLRSEDFYVRYNSAKILGKRGDRDARVIMARMLAVGDPPSRASVARHLYGFSWFAAEPLIRQALKDNDARVREAAIYALCDMRDLNAYNLMVEVLKNEPDNVREAAAWGLRDCQDAAAVRVLEVVLEARDPDVRIKALEALGANDTQEAMAIVRYAMNDPEPDVKYAATLSLLELAGEVWLQELSGIIGRTNGVTRQQVLRGFFHATNYLKIDVATTPAADLMIDALETALLDDLEEVRMAVVWPLAWMRHKRTSGVLKRAYLIEQSPEVKAHIVRVSASLSSEAGEDILKDAVKSPIAIVRAMAEQILSERAYSTLVGNASGVNASAASRST